MPAMGEEAFRQLARMIRTGKPERAGPELRDWIIHCEFRCYLHCWWHVSGKPLTVLDGFQWAWVIWRVAKELGPLPETDDPE
jgi:hypothetical protein